MNEKQQLAIQLFSTGKTGAEVAELLQVTPKTVSTWRQDPEFRAELNRQLLDIKTAHSERLRSLCASALQTIENCLKDEKLPLKEKLAASFKILELGHVKPSLIGSTDPAMLALEEKLRM